MSNPHADLHDRLLRSALRLPESYVESPWGHLVVKVNKKIFAFIDSSAERVHLGLKIKRSQLDVLEHGWAVPMGYGMGRHGWVSMSFDAATALPFEQCVDWLDESYRDVAPKRLVKALPPEGVGPAPALAPPPPPEPQVDPDDLAVLLVGNDTYRLERGRLALAHLGHAAVCAAADDDALDIAGSAEPRLVVLDLSKDATQCLELGPALGMLTPEGKLVIAGLRDAKQQRKVEAAVPAAALLSKEAPGAPKLLKQLAELL